LYALLIDAGNNSEANSQSGGGLERNIRRSMLDLNRQPEGSSDGSVPFSNQPAEDVGDSHEESVVGDPTTHPYLLHNDSDDDDVDNEPTVLPPEEDEDDEEEEEEEEEEDVEGVNYFGHTQPAYAQPTISRPYDHPGHFRTLNLGRNGTQ
ncbi:hypothetical protein PIB30_098351, partial [Stylosanthes scabra]|nr:hypothetical protein [Stylosanthes scabra]